MPLAALLDQGLAALPITLPSELPRQIEQYLLLLEKWNRVHNLTAVRDPQEQLRLHVMDCLAVLPLLGDMRFEIADVGSGAGFPGLLWAMARPQWHLYLLESNNKKAAFLREVKRLLSLNNVEVLGQRAEQWQPPMPLDWIVSRALADIDGFLQLTAHLGNTDSCWGLMKAHDDETCQTAGFLKVRVEIVEVPLLAAPRLWVTLRRKA